jgi:hypothetical protein
MLQSRAAAPRREETTALICAGLCLLPTSPKFRAFPRPGFRKTPRKSLCCPVNKKYSSQHSVQLFPYDEDATFETSPPVAGTFSPLRQQCPPPGAALFFGYFLLGGMQKKVPRGAGRSARGFGRQVGAAPAVLAGKWANARGLSGVALHHPQPPLDNLQRPM